MAMTGLSNWPATLAVHLDGKVAVVTGAGSGIGRATARRLALSGVAVAALDIDPDGIGALSQEVRQAGGTLVPYAVSVTNRQALQHIAADIQARFGPCHILVNNAGVLLRGDFADDNADALWDTTIDVNLNGTFSISRAFYQQLRDTRGCIVNVASIHACVAVKNSVAYTVSKGGIKQMTQALALELGPLGIRVNAVAPGLIATDMTRKTTTSPEHLQRFLERVPLNRRGEPDDVVDAICFLAGDSAAYITGVTLPVDGGYLAN